MKSPRRPLLVTLRVVVVAISSSTLLESYSFRRLGLCPFPPARSEHDLRLCPFWSHGKVLATLDGHEGRLFLQHVPGRPSVDPYAPHPSCLPPAVTRTELDLVRVIPFVDPSCASTQSSLLSRSRCVLARRGISVTGVPVDRSCRRVPFPL
nr:hypothetical protein PsAHV6-043 [Psittacid alphaherpesvirus 6]